jgi:hypothetical protein
VTPPRTIHPRSFAAERAAEFPLDIVFHHQGKRPLEGPTPETFRRSPRGAFAPRRNHRFDYIPDFGIRLMNFFSVTACCISCMRAFTWPLTPLAAFNDILYFSC